MTWPHFVIYLVVIGIGLPSALRNPTALALVLNWAIGEATWMLTGNSLPLKVYVMADIVVLAAICLKATIREGCHTYSGIGEQARCFWRSLTIWDRWIAASYIFAVWPVYAAAIEPRAKWFVLFGLLIVQFLLAGAEAARAFLSERKARRMASNHSPRGNGLAFARGIGGRV